MRSARSRWDDGGRGEAESGSRGWRVSAPIRIFDVSVSVDDDDDDDDDEAAAATLPEADAHSTGDGYSDEDEENERECDEKFTEASALMNTAEAVSEDEPEPTKHE